MQNLQNTRKRTSLWVFFALLLLVAGFAGGWYAGRGVNSSAQGTKTAQVNVTDIGSAAPSDVLEKNVSFNQFWELWKLLKLKFYQDTPDQDMLYGAMIGLAQSLGDPYTTFFEPKVAKDFSDSLKGEFEGIGAEIGMRNGQIEVIAPLSGTPAEKAGLMAGDAILEINGTSTESMSTDQAVTLIRGPKGTSVKLKIGRLPKAAKIATGSATSTAGKQVEPQIIELTIKRAQITVKSVKLTWPKDGIGMIEITNFDQNSDAEFQQAVDKVLEKNPKGVILDLRNDPGGYLDRSATVAGEWVGDKVVVSERRKGKIIDEYHGTGRGKLNGLPTVVLVNQGSASAAEIVAGCLQDYDIATLIGMKTFGKGSVQDYTEFSDGSAVKITIAEWLTPKGRSINKIGIKPDIEVDRTLEDYNANRDPQLDKALWFLTSPTSSRATIHATTK